jgi:hypothetical protein
VTDTHARRGGKAVSVGGSAYFDRVRPVLLALVTLAGCAHAPRGHWNAAERRMCVGDICYHVGPLPGWRVVHKERGQIGFYDDRGGAVIQSNATCRDDADAAPLRTLTRHLLIGYTDRHIRSQKEVELDRRAALHSVIDVRLDGVPMVLDLYVLKRNGCIFDLSLAAPPDAYAASQPQFQLFVDGFAQEPS